MKATTRSRFFTTLLVLIGTCILCGVAHAQIHTPSYRRIIGLYSNEVYGYTIRLPSGIVGSASHPYDLPGMEKLSISLDYNGRRRSREESELDSSIEIQAEDMYLDYPLDRKIQGHVNDLIKEGATIKSNTQTSIRLGALPATLVTIEYSDSAKREMVDLYLSAMYQANTEDRKRAVYYKMELKAPKSKLPKHRRMFDQISRSFKLLPSPE
jgi:hypothetical protein